MEEWREEEGTERTRSNICPTGVEEEDGVKKKAPNGDGESKIRGGGRGRRRGDKKWAASSFTSPPPGFSRTARNWKAGSVRQRKERGRVTFRGRKVDHHPPHPSPSDSCCLLEPFLLCGLRRCDD